jgi:hypothetical protein
VRRVMLLPLAFVLLLAGAVPAAAHHGVVQGNTWYSDGTKLKAGYVGDTVEVFATNAYPGIPFMVAARPVAHGQSCNHPTVLLNSPTVTSLANGAIAPVRIPFELSTQSTPPGDYHLCFVHVGAPTTTGATFTAPVIFTVLPDTTS